MGELYARHPIRQAFAVGVCSESFWDEVPMGEV